MSSFRKTLLGEFPSGGGTSEKKMQKRAAIESAAKAMTDMVVVVESAPINMLRLVDRENKIHEHCAEEKNLLRKQRIAVLESEKIDKKIKRLISLKNSGVLSE